MNDNASIFAKYQQRIITEMQQWQMQMEPLAAQDDLQRMFNKMWKMHQHAQMLHHELIYLNDDADEHDALQEQLDVALHHVARFIDSDEYQHALQQSKSDHLAEHQFRFMREMNTGKKYLRHYMPWLVA